MDKRKLTQNIIIFFLCVFTYLGGTYSHDKFAIERLAKTASINDHKTGHCYDRFMFYADNTSCLVRTPSNNATAIAYVVSNNTYSTTKIDFNKSKLVGKWLGKKGKQIGEGIIEGWTAPSKYKDR